jgi:hypothetical protein
MSGPLHFIHGLIAAVGYQTASAQSHCVSSLSCFQAVLQLPIYPYDPDIPSPREPYNTGVLLYR